VASSSVFGVTDSEFGGSRQRFTFTKDGAQPVILAPEPMFGDFTSLDLDLLNVVAASPTTIEETDLTALEPVELTTAIVDADDIFTELMDISAVHDNIPIIEIPDLKEASPVSLSDDGYQSTGSPCHSILDSSELVDDPTDPAWMPDDVQFVKTIDARDDADLYQRIMQETGMRKKTRRQVKHRGGQKRLADEELKDAEHAFNVNRCREYRRHKKMKEENQLTEVENLELENARLKEKEERMTRTLARVKQAYISLIVNGTIRMI